MNKPSAHQHQRREDRVEAIELLESGARLRLHDGAAEERPWWSRLAPRRKGSDTLVLTGLPPRPNEPRDEGAFPCPQCGTPGHVDIFDRMSGRRYISCNSCFKMWQDVSPPSIARDVSWLMK